MPSIAATGLKRGYKEVTEADEAEVRRRGDEIVKQEGMGADLGVGQLERQADVEAAWKNGVDGLGRLRRTMPEMVAKKERAERAEDYVRTMGKK